MVNLFCPFFPCEKFYWFSVLCQGHGLFQGVVKRSVHRDTQLNPALWCLQREYFARIISFLKQSHVYWNCKSNPKSFELLGNKDIIWKCWVSSLHLLLSKKAFFHVFSDPLFFFFFRIPLFLFLSYAAFYLSHFREKWLNHPRLSACGPYKFNAAK